MRRISVLVMVVALLGFGNWTSAQESDDRAIGANLIGEPVTVYDAQAAEAAQLTVIEVVDDFDDYAEFYEPRRNDRYVFVAVEIEITGERPYEFQPYDLNVLDSIGQLHSQGFGPRSDQSTVETPDLEEANLLPGETVRGGALYVVPADAALTQVVYMPYIDGPQLYLLADLTEEASAEADEADAESTPEQ